MSRYALPIRALVQQLVSWACLRYGLELETRLEFAMRIKKTSNQPPSRQPPL